MDEGEEGKIHQKMKKLPISVQVELCYSTIGMFHHFQLLTLGLSALARKVKLSGRGAQFVGFSGFFIAIAFSIFSVTPTFAAANTWTQTDWSGGVDGGVGATHPTDQSGWTKYESVSNISGSASPGDLGLSSGNFTVTDDGTLTTSGSATGGGFSSGATASATVAGSGVGASVSLSTASSIGDTFDVTMPPVPVAVSAGGALLRNGADDEIYALTGVNTKLYKYSISGASWTTLASSPAIVSSGIMLRNGSDNDIYVLRSTSSSTFYKYSISSNSWTTLTSAPASGGTGVTMIRNGSDDFIYMLQGNGTGFYKYSISGNSWTTLAAAPASGGAGAVMLRNGLDDTIYVLKGGGTGFYQYSISGDSWTILTAVPAAVSSGAAMIRNGSDNEIYVLRGGSTSFYQYSISGNSWTTLTVVPGTVGVGSLMIRNSSDNDIYVVRGNATTSFYKYSISGNSWTTLTVVPGAVSSGAAMIRNGSDNDIYMLQGGSNGFLKYSISGNSWLGSAVSNTAVIPATVSTGGAMIRNGSDDDVYVLQGGGTGFYKYSISGNSWTTLTVVPGTVGTGAAMIRNGSDNDIYVLRGGSTGFYKYSISGNSWTTLTVVPGTIGTGAAMIRNGSDNDIYVLRGGSTSLYKYSISGNSWTTLTVVPGTVGAGGTMIRNGSDDNIYVLQGGSATGFYKYSISGNSWTTLTVVPGTINTGGTMIRNGSDDDIYVLQPSTTLFYKYSISGNSWTTLASLSTSGGVGAAVIRNGSDNDIYVLKGGTNSTNFYKYSISGNSWTTLLALPSGGGAGTVMMRNASDNQIYILQGNSSTNLWRYFISNLYNSSGTFTSAVIDTAGVTGFGNLSWSSTLPTSTTLTFATRTGSTIVPDGTWSAWSGELSDSSGSAITSPSARYIQYRGTFGTSVLTSTPTLNNITIAYSAYPSAGNLVSSSFNSADAANVISGLSWTEDTTLPTGSSVTISLRTSSSLVGLAGASWFDFSANQSGCTKSADTVTCSSSSIPTDLSTGGDDQYVQYKVSLGATDTSVSPTVGSVIVTYGVEDVVGGGLHTGILTVIKKVINDNGGTKTIVDFPLFVNGLPVTSGISQDFAAPADAYTVTEIGDSEYIRTFSGNCDANGRVSLSPGDYKMCIVINDDIAQAVSSPPVTTAIRAIVNADPSTLPVGGGLVTYTASVTNPGTAPVSDVIIVDDTCGPMRYVSGDLNRDSLLDPVETWIYTCQSNLVKTTSNKATVSGKVNCLTVSDLAGVLVVVQTTLAPVPYSIADEISSSLTIDLDKGLKGQAFGVSANCVSGTVIKLASDESYSAQVDSAVYYCGIDGNRYVFPDHGTYFSWYKDFSGVKTVSAKVLASLPLRGIVTYRPGSRLLKITSDPKVYAVAKGGVLRWVTSEVVARALYGDAWNDEVSDIQAELLAGSYSLGDPITAAEVAVPTPVVSARVCTTSAPFTLQLEIGSSGLQVRRLQELLQCLGYFPANLIPTGYFGSVTRGVVAAFQSAVGITPVGSVGPVTRAELNLYMVK